MPSVPYLVSGTISSSFGNNVSDVVITFTSSEGSDLVTSDSSGKYIFDLGNIGYTSGETVSYSAVGEFNNEFYSGSFVVTGSDKTLDVSLSQRTDAIFTPGNRHIQLFNVGGEVVASENPLPVRVSKIPVNDGEMTLSYTSGNLTGIVKVIGGVTYTRTLSYTSGNLTGISKWVRS